MSAADENGRRLRLIESILQLPERQLLAVEQVIKRLVPGDPDREGAPAVAPAERSWPHAPLHRLSEQGTYLVTGGTYRKDHHFRGAERLDHLEGKLLQLASEAGWQLEAWAIFSNHYHFVGHARPDSEPLSEWLAELHRQTAIHVNQLDQCPGRQVWFNYWDTQLTFEKSYLARLNYVHHNPVKHGLVPVANQYCWCSAAWFERTATPAQVNTIYGFKIDQVQVQDDFDPI